jgi:hypothetical protein
MTGVSIWQMTEDELLDAVIARCEDRGIHWVHIDNPRYNRRRGHLRGFPDLQLVGTGMMFRELKTANGAWRGLRPHQTDWKYWLLAAGQDWAIWSPRDLVSGQIDAELDRIAVKHATPDPVP